jgi:hypothetical protein
MVADRFDYLKIDAAFEVVQQQLYTQGKDFILIGYFLEQ